MYSTVQKTVSFYNESLSRMDVEWEQAMGVLQEIRNNDKEFFNDGPFALL